MKNKLHIPNINAFWLCAMLFIVIFLILRICVPCTLMSWESECLYLDTPDYMRELHAASHSTWQLCLNYLCQFFYYRWAGPAILALGFTILFGLFCLLFRRPWLRIVMALHLVVALGILAIKPDTQANERWHRLEQAAENYRWAEVMEIATPERCQSEREMLPYALLGLAATGQLPERMCQYPVEGVHDFDTQGEHNRRYYFFKMVLYDVLGSPNEAIHNAMQAAAISSPYGLTMGTLRRLVRLHRKAGNEVMSNKYATILRHSTLHANWKLQDITSEDVPHTNESAHEPVITESLGFNVGVMLNQGLGGPIAIDYLLCQLLANGNLSNFVTTLLRITQDKSVPLPTHYQEALLYYAHLNPSFNVDAFVISPNIRSAFQQFITTGTASPGSFWSMLSTQ